MDIPFVVYTYSKGIFTEAKAEEKKSILCTAVAAFRVHLYFIINSLEMVSFE